MGKTPLCHPRLWQRFAGSGFFCDFAMHEDVSLSFCNHFGIQPAWRVCLTAAKLDGKPHGSAGTDQIAAHHLLHNMQGELHAAVASSAED